MSKKFNNGDQCKVSVSDAKHRLYGYNGARVQVSNTKRDKDGKDLSPLVYEVVTLDQKHAFDAEDGQLSLVKAAAEALVEAAPTAERNATRDYSVTAKARSGDESLGALDGIGSKAGETAVEKEAAAHPHKTKANPAHHNAPSTPAVPHPHDAHLAGSPTRVSPHPHEAHSTPISRLHVP